MYEECLHEQEWSYGAHFCPGGDAGPDYARHLRGEAEAAAKARAAFQKLAILIIQEVGVPSPDAVQRTQIAAVTASPEFRSVCCAIVTTNSVLRGVITALNWLRKREYQEAVFSESESALAWLERTCGRPLPALRRVARGWRTVSCRYGSRPARSG